jgi:hypothetical protein
MKQAMKLGYSSAGTMIKFINSGTMNNISVTAHDAAIAYAAYGTPIPPIVTGLLLQRLCNIPLRGTYTNNLTGTYKPEYIKDVYSKRLSM